MGVVVAARHVQLDVLYALKLMTHEALEDADLVARFLREARAAARLRGEHIARVTDVGTLESGAPYQVIEYLEGKDLAALLAECGPLPVGRAVALMMQACEGLDEAHRVGIVHRDIKPSNLFLTERPNGSACLKVLDFGISKSERTTTSSGGLASTRSRSLLGSPSYMAPEQMRAANEVDARADIWALGATLYELLAGRVPFEAKTLLDLALQIAQGEPAPLRTVRADVPPALEAVVLRCMAKEPDDRFSDVRALASGLAPYARRGISFASLLGPVPETTLPPMPPAARLPSEAQEAQAASPTGAKVSWGTSLKSSRRRWRAVSGLLGACAIGASLSGVLWLPQKEPAPKALGITGAITMPDTGPPRRAEPATSAAPELSAVDEVDAGPHIPTWSVTDLPTAPPPTPAFVPPAPPQPAPSSTPPPVAPLASAQPDCSRPTYFDEHGRVKFKLECLDLPAPRAPDAGAITPAPPRAAPTRALP
jgi:serine/threonine-protein kinase